MKKFMDENLLLSNHTAIDLYHHSVGARISDYGLESI
jgi:hypothetical protein